MKTYLSTALLIVVIISGCDNKRASEFNLYYLGGQSNMEGYGYCSELPDSLNGTFDNILIFHGNSSPDGEEPDGKGIWAPLRPGHGGGFVSDGVNNNYSDRFGCELSFGLKIKELNSGTRIALLKYARGGTSIDEEAAGNFGSWDPQYLDGAGINQYDHFLAAVDNALSIKDIDGDGKEDRLIPSGIIWMQGESDAAFTEEIAARYYDNLDELMKLLREALGDPTIPVVIGRISDSGNNPSGKVWEFGETVRRAQHEFAEKDPDAAIVTTTDNYSYSDPWHYDSDAYIDLGRAFALALDSLADR
ncbi:MAG TPA: hypothetical protein ENH59_00725 [Bacteroidetes bacterium]|nr:hypothetical protein [Bacteroidota bacterium]